MSPNGSAAAERLRLREPNRRPAMAGIVNLACKETTRVLIQSDEKTSMSLDGKHWSQAVLTWNYPGRPAMENAQWIWTSYLVSPAEAVSGSGIITFSRSFIVKQEDAGRATLQITADSAYDASFNGRELGSDGPSDAKSSHDHDSQIAVNVL
jgi:hypothetical protein